VFSLRVRIFGFIAVIQSILFVAHWFVYETWTHLRADPDPPGITRLQVALAVLSAGPGWRIAELYEPSNTVARSVKSAIRACTSDKANLGIRSARADAKLVFSLMAN
jgi:hypothetical protein